MAQLQRRKWLVAAIVPLFSGLVLATSAAPASAAGTLGGWPAGTLAPGVTYHEVDIPIANGSTAHGHVVEVDLRNPLVSVDLLTAGAVAARAPISQQADARGAIAGVNGDFFNISNTQAGVEVTGSSVGPAIASGRQLKGAVAGAQRFGPALPPGTTTEDVLGVGVDRVARLARISFEGKASIQHGGFTLNGFNQYALPVNGIGVFNSDWGTVSRKRSTCGTETNRSAPCSENTFEVTIRHNKVVQTATEPGSGAIDRDTVVLVGRDTGADTLRALQVGQHIKVDYDLHPNTFIPFKFAVGGYPILRDGQPLDGVDPVVAAIRTSAGFSSDGRRLYLMSLDGTAAGLTILDLALAMKNLGAADAMNLDGGGSSTLVTRNPGEDTNTARNHPTGGAERPVPNGIGVFSLLR